MNLDISSQRTAEPDKGEFLISGWLENIGGFFGGDDRATKSVQSLRHEINNEAKSAGVDPMVVATILYAEQRHRSPEDGRQEELAARALVLGPTPLRDITLSAINRDWSMDGNDIRHKVTLGAAQMSVDGVSLLVGNGAGQKNYLSDIVSREQFQLDPLGTSLSLLLDEKYAPALIAAWCERVIDKQSEQKGGEDAQAFQYVDFSAKNPKAHYVFLTGTYSSGGYFHGVDKKPDPALNSDPLSYTDLNANTGPNGSASNALGFRDEVWKALTGRDYRPETDPLLKKR
jgi:hypothetical protein